MLLRSAISMFALLASLAPHATAAANASGQPGPAAAVAPRPDPASQPHLLIPARRDSVSIESEAAPLIVPGASVTIDSVTRTPQRFAREQFALGLEMERVGALPTAVMAYTNAIHADSTLPGPCLRLARLEMGFGHAKRAEQLIREELHRNPKDTDASRELGLALSRRGKHAEAIARLKGLTRLEPRRDEHWYALGLALANANRLSEAEAPLRRAIALSPDRALEHRDLGVVLAALNRPREAREEYARARAIDPRDASIWINLANLEAHAGRPDSALADYREAERSDSTYLIAYEGQLKTLTRLDRRDEIADLYMRWVTMRPDDDALRMRAVRNLAAIDRRDRALEIGRDGVRHNARSPLAHMILGMSLDAYGSTRQALAELRRADALFTSPRDHEHVRQLIASMRLAAPDSLHDLFQADSVAHARTR